MRARAHVPGALLSLVAAGLWVGLAWRTPTSTHHFAPAVVAGAWGWVTRHGRLPSPGHTDRLVLLLGGLVVAVGALGLLAVAGKLQGPPLLTAVPVPVELPAMAVLGALAGSGARRLTGRPPATAASE